MCILNRGKEARSLDLVWGDETVIDELSGREAHFKARLYRVRDLWTGEDIGTTREDLSVEVSGHDVLMVRLIRLLEPQS